MSGRPDVVVCGGGAAGLAAALALGRRGLDVVVLEKRRDTPALAKGEVLQPPAVRVLGAWGVLDGLRGRGAAPLSRVVIRDACGTATMAFEYGTLPAGYTSLLAAEHPAILGALADGLPDGVEFRRGAVVEGLLRDASGRVRGVRIREGGRRHDQPCALVVAADGVSSRLRREARIPAAPHAYPHRLVAWECPGPPPRPDEVTAYDTVDGLRLVYPLPGARTRLYAQVTEGELRGTHGAGPWAALLARGVPELGPLAGRLRGDDTRQTFALRRFVAPSLAVPGLVLVGEAAHAVHSLAAQGMNTALADAEALARHLGAAGVDGPRSVDRALRGYEAERLPWIRHVDRLSHEAVGMVIGAAWPSRVLARRALERIRRSPRMTHTATYNLAGLGIRPFRALDRLHQLGLPDPRAGLVPDWPPALAPAAAPRERE
ncbi:FAD-dependent oxidoreductase [Streptomyces yaizuensis]|uniref:FAD-dependent monooxygenase n=1 Tax=Streptomyces yaizuensis TaxID=2989713 RepID=A0ABQ5NSD5_9ACTN|nr:NAD(P)/FAD-dependent oxidoreductase [Streptomyces sp. YSPA8]GLF93053.1 FAD-dependent monooxygenase [Streptomyces sp. YSPA8]